MRKIILALLWIPLWTAAQKTYQVNDIVVKRNGNTMQNPWAGGLNNPVFSPMDINGDSMMDLLIYDKAAWKALAFVNTGSPGHLSFTYAPEYDHMFPEGLRDWVLARDYNHDGVEDLFALTSNSDIALYKGYRNGNLLSYQMIYPHLYFTFGANSIHIWTQADNMPVIMDVDGDGDIDILAPDQSGGVTLSYYQNQAIDSGYDADSIRFRIADQCWGRFMENTSDCSLSLAQCKKDLTISEGPSSRHMGGACTGLHYRQNHVTSLLLSDSYCNSLKFLENNGDSLYSVVNHYDTTFPGYDIPVNLPLFPCAYALDADNDGYEDLFVSPFATNAIQEGQSEDIRTVQFYHNTGIDSVKIYHYMGDTILSNGMIDVGSESHPVFFDYNGDGLIDIVTGNYGEFAPVGYPKSYLALYKNIGTDTMPVYEEENMDWNHLSTFQLNGIYPAFGDLDGDGHSDMVIGDATGNIHFFKNTGGNIAAYTSMTAQNWFGINVGANAAPMIYDVNGDGLNDMVIGSKGNNIMYFWNYGNATTPIFSPDSSNAFFGHIRVYDTHPAGQPPGYAAPWITQENGSLVLYSGSQRGYTFRYSIDTDSLRHGGFALLDSDVLGTKPGMRSTISIADINHDGHPDYLAGNIRGGMSIYSDINWGRLPVISSIPTSDLHSNNIEVYPNPAKDIITCKSSETGIFLSMVQLYDICGSLIKTYVLNKRSEFVLPLDGIPNGMYVIKIITENGSSYQKKIIILKP
jgi:hypothetical protein